MRLSAIPYFPKPRLGAVEVWELSGETIHPIHRDAEYVAGHIAARSQAWPARRRGDHLPMDVEQKA
jgi:hypothetical protein